MKTIPTLPCQYEEIDLTINYDIKRRMGKELEKE